jgi:hypothetical protein
VTQTSLHLADSMLVRSGGGMTQTMMSLHIGETMLLRSGGGMIQTMTRCRRGAALQQWRHCNGAMTQTTTRRRPASKDMTQTAMRQLHGAALPRPRVRGMTQTTTRRRPASKDMTHTATRHLRGVALPRPRVIGMTQTTTRRRRGGALQRPCAGGMTQTMKMSRHRADGTPRQCSNTPRTAMRRHSGAGPKQAQVQLQQVGAWCQRRTSLQRLLHLTAETAAKRERERRRCGTRIHFDAVFHASLLGASCPRGCGAASEVICVQLPAFCRAAGSRQPRSQQLQRLLCRQCGGPFQGHGPFQ